MYRPAMADIGDDGPETQHVVMPGPPSQDERDDVKRQVHLLIGETIAYGARGEWLLRTFATVYADTTNSSVSRCWEAVKAEVRRLGLTDDLQREMADVSRMIEVRNAAAHRTPLYVGVGGRVQILRFSLDREGRPVVHSEEIEELEQAVADARAGHDAVQRIGIALDERRPGIVTGQPRRFLLLGVD